MQTHAIFSNFSSSESWSILSDIERSIKTKIESIGIPLKDWDIQINYGIKTGFNDAFIIDSAKRNEILNACQCEDERQRTAELIRPILRGRMSAAVLSLSTSSSQLAKISLRFSEEIMKASLYPVRIPL